MCILQNGLMMVGLLVILIVMKRVKNLIYSSYDTKEKINYQPYVRVVTSDFKWSPNKNQLAYTDQGLLNVTKIKMVARTVLKMYHLGLVISNGSRTERNLSFPHNPAYVRLDGARFHFIKFQSMQILLKIK